MLKVCLLMIFGEVALSSAAAESGAYSILPKMPSACSRELHRLLRIKKATAGGAGTWAAVVSANTDDRINYTSLLAAGKKILEKNSQPKGAHVGATGQRKRAEAHDAAWEASAKAPKTTISSPRLAGSSWNVPPRGGKT